LTLVSGLPAWSTSTGTVITSYAKTTEKDVNTTTTKTDLLNGEITIAANAMTSSGSITLDCGGDYKNASGAGRTVALELALGSTVLWAATSESIGSDADDRAWHFRVVIQALGATNSQRGSGFFALGTNDVAGVGTGEGGIDQTNEIIAPFLTAASTEDMTSSKALTLSVTHSASSASLRMRLEYASVKVT